MYKKFKYNKKRDRRDDMGREDKHDKKTYKVKRVGGKPTLDLQADKANIVSYSSLLPLASNPARRADLDLYYEPNGKPFMNGGYSNILTNFKTVDEQTQADDQTLEQAVPDIVNVQVNITCPAYYNTEYSNYDNTDQDNYYNIGQVQVMNADGSTANTQLTVTGGGTQNYNFTDANNNNFTVQAYESYLTRVNGNRNTGFQGLYNRFANNNAFTGLQAMNPIVYSYNDTSPLAYNNGQLAPQLNSFMAQGDAVNANMVYLVTALREYKVTKGLLNVFADRHLGLSNYLKQAVSAISSLRYVKLVEEASNMLDIIPCNIDYVENYSKHILMPSFTGDSYYDPILIPSFSIQVPQYQLQGTGGNPFTPGCQNRTYNTETNANILTSQGFNFQITYNGLVFTYQYPAGYPAIVDGNGQLYYYSTQSHNGTLPNGDTVTIPAGGKATGRTAPYAASNAANKLAHWNEDITAAALLNALQQARNQNGNMNTVIEDFRNNGLTFLQDLTDSISRFNTMMAPFMSMYLQIENSNLAKYHSKHWDGDIDLPKVYDGGLGDGVKHPEACLTPIVQLPQGAIEHDNAYLNAHQQYSTGIGLHYTDYNERIIDDNAMYSVVGGWYYNTAEMYMYGDTNYVMPFTDYQPNQNEYVDDAAFDNNNVSYNTFMIPKAIIYPLAGVYDYYGNETVGQVTDADVTTLQLAQAFINDNEVPGNNNQGNDFNSPYPQAGVPVGVYDGQTTPGYFFSAQYLTRIFGVVAIIDGDLAVGNAGNPEDQVVEALFTDGLTSYLPLTCYNDITKYYDEAVNEHPFTVKTKPNAQKVLQVAN